MRRTAAAVAAALILSSLAYATGTEEDKVTLIVELSGEPVLMQRDTARDGYALYSETETAKKTEKKLLSVQEETEEEIKKIYKKAEKGCTYTYLLNGFSVTVRERDIEKIKALPEVTNVWRSERYILHDLPEEENQNICDSCCEMIGGEYMHTLGIRGEGTVIAIIDSEFDINHEFLSSPLDDEARAAIDKSDIKRLISENTLNVHVTANRVYHNSKIPFVYNYPQDTADTYPVGDTVIHGSHVAGIAGGKNGHLSDGTEFDGMAPEAQLILMSASAGGREVDDEKVLAAIDDAAKLGADVINLSLGDDYLYKRGAERKIINAARAAEILVSVSAGNSGRTGGALRTDIPDYSSSGIPATYEASTAVASVDDKRLPETEDAAMTMSSFSSWGTDSSLDLKPEIAAPGSGIYSSIPEDRYRNASGTSMAAPHMSGAAALLKQLIEEKFPDYNGNKAVLAENLAMSTARIMRTADGTPYSPRWQGAGLINLEGAANTDALLLGTDGKTKVSLGEIDKSFEIRFTAKNLTDNALTYDSPSLTVITDNYTEADNGKYKLSGSRPVRHTVTTPQSVEIPAHGETEVVLGVTLDDYDIDANSEIFTNGFFVEGYVSLTNSEGGAALNIPYMGFYGGWDSEPIFDGTYYSGECFKKTTALFGDGEIVKKEQFRLGKNPVLEMLRSADGELYISDYAEKAALYEGEEYAGYSPESGTILGRLNITVTPMRTVRDWTVMITDKNGNTVMYSDKDKEEVDYLDKWTENTVKCDKSLEEGDYTVLVSGTLAYDKRETVPGTISMRFYSDTTAPEFTACETDEENGRRYMRVSAADNRYVAGFSLRTVGEDGEEKIIYRPVLPDSRASASFDITDMEAEGAKLYVYDYAMNKTQYVETETKLEISGAIEDGADLVIVGKISSDEETAADVIAAAYAENGALIGVKPLRNEKIISGESLIPVCIENAADAQSVKLMLWHRDSLTPICGCAEWKRGT